MIYNYFANKIKYSLNPDDLKKAGFPTRLFCEGALLLDNRNELTKHGTYVMRFNDSMVKQARVKLFKKYLNGTIVI